MTTNHSSDISMSWVQNDLITFRASKRHILRKVQILQRLAKRINHKKTWFDALDTLCQDLYFMSSTISFSVSKSMPFKDLLFLCWAIITHSPPCFQKYFCVVQAFLSGFVCKNGCKTLSH